MLDGVDNNETWLQTVVIFPSVDALDEFKLQTSTYSAEFGRSLGGVVNLQIKSGTQRASTAASSSSTATTPSTPTTSSTTGPAGRSPTLNQNQFGATFGGPIIKDKTFFFADYQGLRITPGQTYLSTVPTLRDAAGELLGDQPGHLRPAHRAALPRQRHPREPLGPRLEEHPAAALPRAEHRGHASAANGQTINNYLINPNLERRGQPVRHQDRPPPDARTTASSSATATRRRTASCPRPCPTATPGATFGAGDGNIKAQSLAFNDTHTFSPTLLNEFRFGWNSIKFFMTSIDYGTNPAAAVGIPGINLNDVTSAMTQMTFQNIRNLGANGNQPLITNQNDFQIFDSVT